MGCNFEKHLCAAKAMPGWHTCVHAPEEDTWKVKGLANSSIDIDLGGVMTCTNVLKTPCTELTGLWKTLLDSDLARHVQNDVQKSLHSQKDITFAVIAMRERLTKGIDISCFSQCSI